MKRLTVAAAACAIALTACGRIDRKTAEQLITASDDYQRAYIERTIVWTGKVPADNVDGPIGEKAQRLGLVRCERSTDPAFYNCELPAGIAQQAKNWEPRDRGGYVDYRVPLYEQKLDSVKIVKGSDPAEAVYRFHREPTAWGKKFGRNDVGQAYEFKAVFKKYDDGWHLDHLSPAS